MYDFNDSLSRGFKNFDFLYFTGRMRTREPDILKQLIDHAFIALRQMQQQILINKLGSSSTTEGMMTSFPFHTFTTFKITTLLVGINVAGVQVDAFAMKAATDEQKTIFQYRIRIRNTSTREIQLISRYENNYSERVCYRQLMEFVVADNGSSKAKAVAK
jgi:hypothetical protein